MERQWALLTRHCGSGVGNWRGRAGGGCPSWSGPAVHRSFLAVPARRGGVGGASLEDPPLQGGQQRGRAEVLAVERGREDLGPRLEGIAGPAVARRMLLPKQRRGGGDELPRFWVRGRWP